MKKLYRRRGTVHPSPPTISDHLSFLPAAILALAAALSPDDREVLAYLISGHRCKASASAAAGPDHPPAFACDCFRCYTSYWIRWDSSANRQLIHEIIDAYEEELAQAQSKTGKKGRKERRKRTAGAGSEANPRSGEQPRPKEMEPATESGGGDENETEKGSVRKIVSFIGERIWGAWT